MKKKIDTSLSEALSESDMNIIKEYAEERETPEESLAFLDGAILGIKLLSKSITKMINNAKEKEEKC